MKILVGYKSETTGKNLLDTAIKHAKAFNAEILLATSLMGAEKTEPQKIKKAEQDLEQAKGYLDDAGVKNSTHLLIRGMNPGEDIIKFADEKKVDEIIIAVRNRSQVGKLIFGSTAQLVILEAECPVLAVK